MTSAEVDALRWALILKPPRIIGHCEAILVCHCKYPTLAVDQLSERYMLTKGQECSSCHSNYRRLPQQDLLVASFKLGGWEAVQEVLKELLYEPT